MRNNQELETQRPVETPVKTPNPVKDPSKIDIPKPKTNPGRPKA